MFHYVSRLILYRYTSFGDKRSADTGKPSKTNGSIVSHLRLLDLLVGYLVGFAVFYA